MVTKISDDLPNNNSFKRAVIVTENGDITLHIADESTYPIDMGHQHLKRRHTSWLMLKATFVELIELALKNKGRWVIEGGAQ